VGVGVPISLIDAVAHALDPDTIARVERLAGDLYDRV
jgi:hypothetical protein